MVDKVYNVWRRDIAAEYVITTGRAFPSMGTPKGDQLRKRLVRLSDMDNVPTVTETLVLMRVEGLLV